MARMNRPAPVEITYKNMRFLITHNPTNATLHKFIEVSVGLNILIVLFWIHNYKTLIITVTAKHPSHPLGTEEIRGDDDCSSV